MSSLFDQVNRSIFTKDQIEANAGRLKNFTEYQARFAGMTDEQLAKAASYYLGNAARCEWLPGEPVYDGILQHNIIPEMISRLLKPKKVTWTEKIDKFLSMMGI